MAIAFKCDICCEYFDKSELLDYPNRVTLIDGDDKNGEYILRYDCCTCCYNRIKDFIRKLQNRINI